MSPPLDTMNSAVDCFFEIISSVVMHVFSQNLEDLTLFFDVFSQVTIIIKLFSVIESSY